MVHILFTGLLHTKLPKLFLLLQVQLKLKELRRIHIGLLTCKNTLHRRSGCSLRSSSSRSHIVLASLSTPSHSIANTLKPPRTICINTRSIIGTRHQLARLHRTIITLIPKIALTLVQIITQRSQNLAFALNARIRRLASMLELAMRTKRHRIALALIRRNRIHAFRPRLALIALHRRAFINILIAIDTPPPGRTFTSITIRRAHTSGTVLARPLINALIEPILAIISNKSIKTHAVICH